MIDHAARTEVCRAVEDYLFDRATSSELDLQLFPIGEPHLPLAEDETLKTAKVRFWACYSDTEDHHIRVDRAGWDYLQRWLLLLRSGGEVEETTQSHRDWTQLVAISAVALIGLAFYLNPYVAFRGFFPVCATVSGLLYLRRRRRAASFERPNPWPCYPFESLGEIREALRRVPKFRKHKFRRELTDRLFDRPIARISSWIVTFVILFFCSPIVLLAQSRPLTSYERRIVWQ
jgi:hypothetical protein